MYACKNCGSNLKFDIAGQNLLCTYCSSTFSPYDIVKDCDVGADTYETNVFTCPSCGGEIRADENEATAVCIYCGGSNVLTSRISNEKKPEYIIPFKITKEKCNEIYAKKLKRYIFAPSEIKRKLKADSFRGIYMPYWVYSITQKCTMSLDGKRDYMDSGKSVSDTYKIEGVMDNAYLGITYDASSSFPDNMSQVIAPYDVTEMKKFTPSYLSGFYADVSDTSEEIYNEEAFDLVNDNTLDAIGHKIAPIKLDIKEETDLSKALNTQCDKVQSSLLPVWFMSFKHHGRMSYSVINGQTGDIYADIPISIRKYLLGSLILFIPFFILFNTITLTPRVLIFLTGIFSFITILWFNKRAGELYLQENNLDDKGYCYHNGMPIPKSKIIEKKKAKKERKTIIGGAVAVVALLAFYLGGFVLGLLFVIFYGLYTTGMYGMVFPTLSVAFYIVGQVKYTKKYNKAVPPTIISALVSVATGIFFVTNPVYDFWYYSVAILGILSVIFNVFCIVRLYNQMATRPMPQFKRTGGDDDAV